MFLYHSVQILIKKSYPNRRKKNKARSWKLKSLSKDVENIWVDENKAKSKQAQIQEAQVR
jgi:nonsense-mediated mRNA decay protein 3